MVQIPIRYPAADLRSIHQMGKYSSNGNCIHCSSKLADEARAKNALFCARFEESCGQFFSSFEEFSNLFS